MPAKDPDLHGNAPDRSRAALLIVDMINDLEWEGGDKLLPYALAAGKSIAALKARAKACGVPVIYANDNFGRWRSDFRDVERHCLEDGVRGEPLARLLRPVEDDYFVLKPKHSAFFATTLETLLSYLGARRLVITGVAGDACVAITAMDAFLRDYEIHVPADCTASGEPADNDRILAYMHRVLHADVSHSQEIALEALSKPATDR